MFIPTTRDELIALNWTKLDIILVSGDAYIDSSYNGIAIIGHLLLDKGFRVGIISQPDIMSGTDITRLGDPGLFWGISSGAVDSMVSNYTATRKRRNKDDLTPGGINNRRPDRALIVYSNLIRRHFKNTAPIVLGGLEASLRRIAHYDYWDNKIRRPILFDAKADYLVYGMAEKTIVAFSEALKNKKSPDSIRGLCYISNEVKSNYVALPSYQEVTEDKNKFIEMFSMFYENNDPVDAKGIYQQCGNRMLIHNPPGDPLAQHELDYVYNLDYERAVHPHYEKQGKVGATDTIRFSITTHRGCFGECNFCAIAVHQGKNIISRSESSILKEIMEITKHKDFRGIINDVGGPTANMYLMECKKKESGAEPFGGRCRHKRCLYPETCGNLSTDHSHQIRLLEKIKNTEGVKKVFVSSGIRYDLILNDEICGEEYLEKVMHDHASGQLKIAPEHSQDRILRIMGKPGNKIFIEFLKLFKKVKNKIKKEIYLTYYFIVAHPGCSEIDDRELKKFILKRLRMIPEQIQIFTPAPSTYSTLMYYTEMNPFTGENIFIEKNMRKKENQKKIIVKR